MRKAPNHPRFRKRSTIDLEVVKNTDREPIERLARLMSVVYQIRCNLVHGSKDPDNVRDRSLVSSSQEVLERVLAVMLSNLEAAS